jgi:hypothetical protein
VIILKDKPTGTTQGSRNTIKEWKFHLRSGLELVLLLITLLQSVKEKAVLADTEMESNEAANRLNNA